MGPCCLLGDVGRGQVQPSGLVVGAAAEHLKRFDARSAQARQKTNGENQLQTATIQKIRKKANSKRSAIPKTKKKTNPEAPEKDQKPKKKLNLPKKKLKSSGVQGQWIMTKGSES